MRINDGEWFEKVLPTSNSLVVKYSKSDTSAKLVHQRILLDALEQNSFSSLKEFVDEHPSTANWLRTYDKVWWEAHKPISVTPDTGYSEDDLARFDTEISESLEAAAAKIGADPEIRQITPTAIFNEIGKPGFIMTHADNLPKTLTRAIELAESLESWAKRRIANSLKVYQAKQCCPNRQQFLRHAGVRNYDKHPQLRPMIDDALQALAKYPRC